MEVSITFLLSELRETYVTTDGKIITAGGDGGYQENKANKQGAYEHPEIETASTGPKYIFTKFFAYIL